MPTTLPDRAPHRRHQREHLLAGFLPAVLAVFYLLLLASSSAGLATDLGALFAPDHHPSRISDGPTPAYNPIEPVGLRPRS